MPEEVTRQNIRNQVRSYILTEFLPDEDASALTDATPLISGGILDSIANARMVSFLEESFAIKFASNEVGPDRLDTVDRIVETVIRKTEYAK